MLLSAGCSSDHDDSIGGSSGSYKPNDIILFEDTVAHDLCVNFWDINNDGQLSYTEAATVKSIGEVFRETRIVHFNELKYFTGLTTIGADAFWLCSSLTSITIPDSVTSIGEGAFAECHSLISITIPNSVTSIGADAFFFCSSLTSITIPNSVTSIGKDVFCRCYSLTSITIPKSVTSIGEGAFWYCNSLTSITIPQSVASIGSDAFTYCSLTNVYCKPTMPPALDNSVFDGTPSDMKIYVPRASVNAYKQASYWRSYASQIFGYDF